MELKWLEDFLSLSEHLNFSRAANDRHVTQSALSRRIKQLEAWVGVPLIDRTTYPVSLTAAGQNFLPRAQDAVELLIGTRDTLCERHTPNWEVLSFATLNTLSLTFFPAWMAEIEASGEMFRTRFASPHASFLGNMSTLLNEDCDFLLTYAHGAVTGMEDLEGFPFLPLGRERVIPVSACQPDGTAAHTLEGGSRPTDYLSYRGNSFFASVLAALFEKTRFRLNTVYENGMSVALKAMAVSGHGVAWIPESLMLDELERGILVRAGHERFDLNVEIRAYRTTRFRNRHAERFWRRASHLAGTGNASVYTARRAVSPAHLPV